MALAEDKARPSVKVPQTDEIPIRPRVRVRFPRMSCTYCLAKSKTCTFRPVGTRVLVSIFRAGFAAPRMINRKGFRTEWRISSGAGRPKHRRRADLRRRQHLPSPRRFPERQRPLVSGRPIQPWCKFALSPSPFAAEPQNFSASHTLLSTLVPSIARWWPSGEGIAQVCELPACSQMGVAFAFKST
jgi:hypothetical protein